MIPDIRKLVKLVENGSLSEDERRKIDGEYMKSMDDARTTDRIKSHMLPSEKISKLTYSGGKTILEEFNELVNNDDYDLLDEMKNEYVYSKWHQVYIDDGVVMGHTVFTLIHLMYCMEHNIDVKYFDYQDIIHLV